METVDKLLDISSRIEHLENAAEWIVRETANVDGGLSQTGTLICVLAEEVREKIYSLIKQMEEMVDETEMETFH